MKSCNTYFYFTLHACMYKFAVYTVLFGIHVYAELYTMTQYYGFEVQ